MPECSHCGATFRGGWGHHYRFNPDCAVSDDDSDDEYPGLVDAPPSDEEESPLSITELRSRFQKDTAKETIASDLLDLRYKHGFDEKDISLVKTYVDKWRRLEHEVTAPASPPASASASASVSFVSTFEGLQTKKQEFARVRRKTGYLEPRRVQIGEHDIVSFDTADLLTRKLQNDAEVRRECQRASDLFKTGSLHKHMPDELTDITSGAAARFHPHLMRKATQEGQDDLRIPLIFNCDDIEVRSEIASNATDPA
jgi:hypothetical protein